MMTGSGPGTEWIDQAFFGFSPVEDLTIVASSLPNDDDERKWMALLRQHVRLKSHPDISIPPHALSYYLFSAELAVVLRRVSRGDSGGRNNSHALIGSPRVLTPKMALRLERWPGWQEDPPTDRRMSQLRPDQLACGFDPADEFYAQLKEDPGNLERVLGGLLRTQGHPLSIIGCPWEERIALLWGLMEIGESALESQGISRDWTFSTHEIDHGDAIKYLPKIVCLPARPVGVSVAHRTTVDLIHGSPVDSRVANRAHELVEQYIHGRQYVPPPPPFEVDQPPQFEAGPPPQLERERPFEAVVPAHSAHHPGPAELVHVLLAAQHPEDFDNRLTALESSAGSTYNRQKIRDELGKRGYGVALINRLLPFADRELIFKRLIAVAFGNSLSDFNAAVVRQHAERLIEDSPAEWDEFVSALAQVATMHDRDDQIARSLERRWPGRQQSTPPDRTARGRLERATCAGADNHFGALTGSVSSGPAPVPSGRGPVPSGLLPVLPSPTELMRQYKHLIVRAGWIASLVLSFVFGLFVASFTMESPPAASPTPETPKQAAVDRHLVKVTSFISDSKTKTTQLSVTPQDRLADGDRLWLIVERGDGTKFPEPEACSRDDQSNWECTEIYYFTDAVAKDDRIVLVVANPDAAKNLAEVPRSKDDPGKGRKDLPSGAMPTDLILIGRQ